MKEILSMDFGLCRYTFYADSCGFLERTRQLYVSHNVGDTLVVVKKPTRNVIITKLKKKQILASSITMRRKHETDALFFKRQLSFSSYMLPK